MVNTNWLYGPIYGIRTLIANSAAFRTAIGAASVAIAKQSIYTWQAYDGDYDASNDAQSVPRVVLRYEDVGTNKRSTTGWGGAYIVQAEFEFVPTSTDDEVAAEAFLSTLQTIINEVLALEGTDSHTIIEDIEGASSVEISDPDDENEGQRIAWYGIKFMSGVR